MIIEGYNMVQKVTSDVYIKLIKALKEYFHPIYFIKYIDLIKIDLLFFLIFIYLDRSFSIASNSALFSSFMISNACFKFV